MLKNSPGVKPEEMQWYDLESRLREHRGPVTKAELSDYRVAAISDRLGFYPGEAEKVTPEPTWAWTFQRQRPMSSNVVHLKKPKGFHPAMGLAMARTAMRLGRKWGDPGLVSAGKSLFDQSEVGLGSPTSDQTSSPSRAPKVSPNSSSPAPIASAR